jgi:2-dehydro-3-deoxyphosphooctonate aldolase (KDO 8-P synthase)
MICIKLGKYLKGDMKKFKIIAGNCVIEDIRTSLDTAKFLKEMEKKYNLDLIYKSSFKKDNRSSVDFFSSIGLEKCTKIFKKIKSDYNFKIITDFHNLYELKHKIINEIDIIQIPAYLCMQTELVLEMAKTKKIINIKKGQFLHPNDIKNIINKIKSTGNNNIIITERGSCYGYRDLVVDPRSFYILKKFKYPVIFDGGHSVRKYGIPSSNIKMGGAKEHIETLVRSAIVNFVDGIFVEVHPNPPKAKCDAATQLSFSEFDNLMKNTKPLWDYINN